MNPAIVIPTYWSAQRSQAQTVGRAGTYDFATPVAKPLPELETCLRSLDAVRGVLRVIVLVVADKSLEKSARARVESMARNHAALNMCVIGVEEEKAIRRFLSHKLTGDASKLFGLRGYGAIKNLGILVAAAFGHDSVVFLDDEVQIDDPDMLIKACYGLGQKSRAGEPILVKTGAYISAEGTTLATNSEVSWTERRWSKAQAFNKLMRCYYAAPERLVRANHLDSCIAALHAEAFTRIPFDPFITRGEDLDYVMNCRAQGVSVWFDKELTVRMERHQVIEWREQLFIQDVYRWMYESYKLEALNRTRGFKTSSLESFSPYPKDWFSKDVISRIRSTCFRRMIGGGNRRTYAHILMHELRHAREVAEMSSMSYASLVGMWQSMVMLCWNNAQLKGVLGE